jgi:crotonobetainyl-CoA:carnitine CoA-transferase CaiB-like acyl-CoA transferase
MAVKPNIDGVEIPLVINHPIKVDAIEQATMTRAPNLGEHSEEILRDLGYSEDAIKTLRADGTI